MEPKDDKASMIPPVSASPVFAKIDPSLPNLGIHELIPPAIMAFQRMELNNHLNLLPPTVRRMTEKLQKQMQIPLAFKAFSASLGENLPLFKTPAIDFQVLKLPAIDFDALYARDERALRFAATHNWFLQPETFYGFTADIDEYGQDIAQLDQLCMDMTCALIPEIRVRLLRTHPRYATLIEEVFRLHDERRYLASIPLAMMCAEGIAHAATEKSIFNTDKNRPAIAGWLDKQDLSRLAKAFLASLTEQHPMSKSRPGKLNRHRVLHDRDTEYGSSLFSCQAISLLGFVGWVFAEDGLIMDVAQEPESASHEDD